MKSRDKGQYLESAVEMARAAGPIALRYFRQPVDVTNKAGGGSFDPVTAADREIEAFLRGEIDARYSGHGVIGEEQGVTAASGPLSWIIDPIDGTRAFISGMPAWGIMIGLLEEGEPQIGVVHQPFTGETFCGDRVAAWLRQGERSQEIRARRTARVERAILYCTHPSMFSGDALSAFERVSAASRMTRFGGDCYSYCLLAAGQIDLVIEGGLQPYDILPLMPILEGAGAVVSDWGGGPAHRGGLVIAAATRELHGAALQLLRGAA